MKIGIIHPKGFSLGGAEAVLINVIEALQDHHELSLYTTGVDLNEMNDFFESSADVESHTVLPFSSAVNRLSKFTLDRYGFGLEQFQKALLNRWLNVKPIDCDMVISTKNEIHIPGATTIQYIHVPQFSGSEVPGVIGNTTKFRKSYEIICQQIGGIKFGDLPNSYYIVNSKWTAKMVEKAYNVTPKVVYPPVKLPDPIQYQKKTDGFVCVGRIVPSKNIQKIIDIISKVIERGFNTHLHIIGPVGNHRYAARIKEICSDRDYLHYEGEVSYGRLKELIQNHRYGIHAREFEHFGIVLAEMAGAGTIPFVPDSGGQTEIVGERDILTYGSRKEAIENIIQVITQPSLGAEISDTLINESRKFSQERFRTQIKSFVDRHNQTIKKK